MISSYFFFLTRTITTTVAITRAPATAAITMISEPLSSFAASVCAELPSEFVFVLLEVGTPVTLSVCAGVGSVTAGSVTAGSVTAGSVTAGGVESSGLLESDVGGSAGGSEGGSMGAVVSSVRVKVPLLVSLVFPKSHSYSPDVFAESIHIS